MKIKANIFNSIGIILMGLLFLICFNLNSYIGNNKYFFIVILLFLIFGIIMIIYGILKIICYSITITKEKLTIQKITKKNVILISDICSVTSTFKRGRDTSFFGKTIIQIETITKTYTITSDDYKSLDKLVKYLGNSKSETIINF